MRPCEVQNMFSIQLSRRCSLTSWFVVLRCAVFIVFNSAVTHVLFFRTLEYFLFNCLNSSRWNAAVVFPLVAMVAQGRRGARRLPWWSDPDWTTIDVGGDVRWITVKTGIEGGVWTGWGGDHDEWWHES